MRTFGTILALLLIFFGLVVAGLVFVRIWQDNGLIRLDINTAAVSTPTATVPVSAAVRAAEAASQAASGAAGGEAGAAGSTAPVVVGIESGGMALGGAPPAAVVVVAPADAAPIVPAATEDPCPPAPAEGFAADTAVVAVGTLRVYSQADVTSPALRDLTAGQGLWIVAGEDGSTAIARCAVIWQRVRTADGLVGWVIKDAVDVVPAPQPTILPTIQATIVATATISPCVGGCATPCCQPCPTPCNQPPCSTPCGVYTQ